MSEAGGGAVGEAGAAGRATAVPSGLAATWILARVALLRLRRSAWAVRFTLLFVALPAAFAAMAVTSGASGWRAVFFLSVGLLAIVPPLHLAPAVAEELEERTFTYLWSRPVPRWSLVSGKLLGLAPVVALVLAGAVALAYPLAAGHQGSADELLRGAAAMAVGAIAASMASVGVGSIAPRYPMPVAVSYLLALDLPVGELPLSLRSLSITYHVRAMAGLEKGGAHWASAVWALGLGAVWLVVALWRTSRTEGMTEK